MKKQRTPFVSVIIPVYNDSERLRKCLDALEKQTYPEDRYEVFVIDNGSRENVETVVAQYAHSKMAQEPESGSYAARNKGISLAKGEVLAFTDSDCIPEPDWIEQGVSHLLEVPNSGFVGGKVETIFKDAHHPNAVELYGALLTYPQQFHIERMKFSVTANLFTFKKVLGHVGTFDSGMKSAGDVEWGERVASFGYALSYASHCRVRHPARRSLSELCRKNVREQGGMWDFKHRHPDLFNRYYKPGRRRPMDVLRPLLVEGTMSPIQRIKVFFVFVLVRFGQYLERFRLFLGGMTKRQ